MERLWLGNNNLNDEGVKALSSSPFLQNVEDLVLGSNNITDTGVMYLAEALKNNSKVWFD